MKQQPCRTHPGPPSLKCANAAAICELQTSKNDAGQCPAMARKVQHTLAVLSPRTCRRGACAVVVWAMQEEEGTADHADLPDGCRLTLQAHAAKDFTLPRQHPGLAFQMPAAAADAPLRPAAPFALLPDPGNDRLLRWRLPAVNIRGATAREDGPPLLLSEAANATRLAAMRGPGTYEPPLWLQVRPAADSATRAYAAAYVVIFES